MSRVEMVYQNMVERRGYRSLNYPENGFPEEEYMVFQSLEI